MTMQLAFQCKLRAVHRQICVSGTA